MGELLYLHSVREQTPEALLFSEAEAAIARALSAGGSAATECTANPPSSTQEPVYSKDHHSSYNCPLIYQHHTNQA